MRTEKQIQASRLNGARSRGPLTPEGKLNSSRNSLRHGLLASTVVLAEEAKDHFIELLQSFIDEFQPATPTQLCLVETMAVARWRLLRIWAAQKTGLDREMALLDPSLGPPCVQILFALRGSVDTVSPEHLMRYETALDRQFSRALSRLLHLKSQPCAKCEFTERTQQLIEKSDVAQDDIPRPGTNPSPEIPPIYTNKRPESCQDSSPRSSSLCGGEFLHSASTAFRHRPERNRATS